MPSNFIFITFHYGNYAFLQSDRGVDLIPLHTKEYKKIMSLIVITLLLHTNYMTLWLLVIIIILRL